MAKRPQQPTSLFKPKGFDHEASELVTVTANENGEFVQVLNHRGSGGRVLFSYQRTPTRIEAISWTVLVDDGPYERVQIVGEQRCLVRRDGTARVERMLPSGKLLLQDPRAGLSIKYVWSPEFNWDRRTPKGGPLGDRATMKRQDENLPWYKSFFQVSTDSSGAEQKELIAVEEYVGRAYQRTVEFA